MTFAHYLTPTNIGDRLCSPRHYFPEWHDSPVAFLYHDESVIDSTTGPLIIGGGGILCSGCTSFYDRYVALKRPLIFWGGGINLIDGEPYSTPPGLNSFDLVGTRDYDCPYPYVPCASCLHPAFDTPQPPPTHDFITYTQPGCDLPIDAPLTLTNDCTDFPHILATLASARTVITTSYHGAYWSMLLGRPVLLMAPDNHLRFNYFKYPPLRCDHSNWRERLAEDPPYLPPDYLAECRALNHIFYTKVNRLLATL